MQITHSGEFKVSRSREDVYDFLSDPEKFAPLLPDFKGVEKREDTYVIKIGVGISHIRGTATIKLNLTESDRPNRATYKGTGSMAGGSVNIDAGFNLEEAEGSTQVNWTGEAQVFGRIASLARGLLQPLAKKNIQVLIDALQQALES